MTDDMSDDMSDVMSDGMTLEDIKSMEKDDLELLLYDTLMGDWSILGNRGLYVWYKNHTGKFIVNDNDYEDIDDFRDEQINKYSKDDDVLCVFTSARSSDTLNIIVDYILADETLNNALSIINSNDPFYDYILIYEKISIGTKPYYENPNTKEICI